MAEIVGVVGSAVGIAGVAGQIFEGAFKLRNLYASYKDVDSEIAELDNDVSIITEVLGELDTQQLSYTTSLPRPPSLERCHRHCKDVADKLQILVIQLESGLRKSQWTGKAKFVGKRDTIKSLREALGRATQSLVLAQTPFYHAATLHAIHQSQLAVQNIQSSPSQGSGMSSNGQHTAQTVTTTLSHLSPNPIDSNLGLTIGWNTRGVAICDRRRSKGQAKSMKRVVVPAFFLGLWAVELHVAKIGWDFNLWLRNVIPTNSPVLEYARNGDVNALCVLFETRVASPFDLDSERGQTPLHLFYQLLRAQL